MKETLKEFTVEKIPESYEEFVAFLLNAFASPEGTAAAFVVAMNMMMKDIELGAKALDAVRLEPADAREISGNFTEMKEKHPEIPRSYLTPVTDGKGQASSDGPFTVTVKITDERPLKKNTKTIYVGCSGTSSYRPLTLASRPPRFIRRRFKVKAEYEIDPWLVTDYPSMMLPVNKK